MEYWIPAATIATIAFIAAVLRFGQWMGAVNSDRDSFRAFMKEIREDIKKILSRLPSDVVSKESPLHLTELGQSISATLKAKKLAKNLALELKEQVEGKPPYEIQKFCFDYINSEFAIPDDLDYQISECAYENGIPRDQVLDALAIELRDELLEISESPSPSQKPLDKTLAV